MHQFASHPEMSRILLISECLACVAGGIVCARNNVLTSKPLRASGEAVRRMERRI